MEISHCRDANLHETTTSQLQQLQQLLQHRVVHGGREGGRQLGVPERQRAEPGWGTVDHGMMG